MCLKVAWPERVRQCLAIFSRTGPLWTGTGAMQVQWSSRAARPRGLRPGRRHVQRQRQNSGGTERKRKREREREKERERERERERDTAGKKPRKKENQKEEMKQSNTESKQQREKSKRLTVGYPSGADTQRLSVLLTWLTGTTARGSGSPRPVDGGGAGRGTWRPQKLKLRRSSNDTAADEVCGTWRRCA